MAEGDASKTGCGCRNPANSPHLGFYGEMPSLSWPDESLPPPDRPHGHPPRVYAEAAARNENIYVALARPLRGLMGVPQSAGITYNEVGITDQGNGWHEFRIAFKMDAQQGHSWTTTSSSD